MTFTADVEKPFETGLQAAEAQVSFRDDEAVGGADHHLQAAGGGRRGIEGFDRQLDVPRDEIQRRADLGFLIR